MQPPFPTAPHHSWQEEEGAMRVLRTQSGRGGGERLDSKLKALLEILGFL